MSSFYGQEDDDENGHNSFMVSGNIFCLVLLYIYIGGFFDISKRQQWQRSCTYLSIATKRKMVKLYGENQSVFSSTYRIILPTNNLFDTFRLIMQYVDFQCMSSSNYEANFIVFKYFL